MSFYGHRAGFSPVADGFYIPQEPYYSGELSSDIPMIICSTVHEQSPSRFDSSLEEISFDGVKEKLQERFGENTSAVVDAYAAAFPSKKPVEIWSMVTSTKHTNFLSGSAFQELLKNIAFDYTTIADRVMKFQHHP